MKNYITIFLSSIFLIACSPKEVSFETLQNRNNIFYEVNVREPFTGIAFTMYENGQMKKEAEFKNGLLHGNYTEWYENGQIKESRKHSKNLFDGKNEMFEKNGDKISEINYKNGEMNGKYFGNREGIVVAEGEISKNRVEYKYFYKNGQIQEQLEFEGNIKFLTNRDWTIEDKTPNLVVKKSFYENGILRSEHYMKKGDGYRHYYSDEGQLTSEELFSNYESVNN